MDTKGVEFLLGQLVERVDQLGNKVQAIVVSFEAVHASLADLRADNTRYREGVTARLGAIENCTSQEEENLQEMKDQLKEIMRLYPLLKAEAFILAGLSIPFILGLLGYLWGLITHKFTLF